VTVSNEGYQPTNVTDRGAVGDVRPDGTVRAPVVRPPWARLEIEGAGELVEGLARQVVGHLAGSYPNLEAATERSRAVRWVVRPAGDPAGDHEVRVRVVAASDKAGTRRSAWVTLPR
jgi:hypothetical protein